MVQKKLEAILRYRDISRHERESYLAQLDANHAAWCASEQWTKDGGQYAKGLENWLAPSKERYEAPPVVGSPAKVAASETGPSPISQESEDERRARLADCRARLRATNGEAAL
jgi:hypothetical protein